MNKKLAIGLFLILLVFTCQAQNLYSKENLKKASGEDLNFYLEKAQKVKKTGNVTTLISSCSVVTGLILFASNSISVFIPGSLLILLGTAGVIVVGIPLIITGSSRIKRINAIKNTAFNDIKIDLAPSGIYNYATQNYEPGITLRVRF